MGTPSYLTVGAAKQHQAMAGVSVSDDQIGAMLAAVEARIETATRRAFVPRTVTETYLADGGTLFVAHTRCRELSAVKFDGETQPVDDFTLTPFGRLKGPLRADVEVTVTYAHGDDAPPDDIVDVTVRAAASLLRQTSNARTGERTDTVVAEGRTINFSAVADLSRGRPFGMPDVDTVIMGYAERRPAIG